MLDDMFQLGEQPYTKEDAEWDNFVATHPNGSFLQTTQWARLKSRFNWTAYRVWVRKDGELVAGAQILFRSTAMRLVKMGYMPHGPIVDWDNTELVKVLFGQIDLAIYKHRAGLLKIEPMVWQRDMSAEKWQTLCAENELITATDTIQPPRTMLIDLTPTEDEIMASFRSKTRYNIRLSGRKDVIVRKAILADLPAFNRLMHTTGERNDFGVHAPQYYQACYELFAERGDATILLAEFEGKLLAGVLLIKNGQQCVYLAGGSSNEERNRMPSYAVQWAAIRWAKQHGCTVYDMWGLPDEDAETLEAGFKERNDGLWGVYRFKRGFNGRVARTVGSADKVYNKLIYKLYKRKRGIE
ncbi:MAG TPA: peptidoglycan bridge formation glycyltransferase FemA/FemB family protein [Anaerolineae bacterium]|nr:peptidoglycan bridge formation glycyltransferase FemA/FemB family protein [Anaerolineae bacterium]